MNVLNVVLNAVAIVLFVVLIVELMRLRRNVNLHHGVLTAVGTMDGLVKALEAGLEGGGLPASTRMAIYRAHDEQVRFVHDLAELLAGVERDARSQIPSAPARRRTSSFSQ